MMVNSSSDQISLLKEIENQLTPDQKICILSLSGDWSEQGYNKIIADLLWSSSNVFYQNRFPPLVERHIDSSKEYFYIKHKLTPLGLEFKTYLEKGNQ